MRCGACGHEHRDDAKFCDQCGVRVAGGAPRPRAASLAYTPRHLAERILTSRAALHGERKPVTVLFVDVQGSMQLAEQVDAEEWHDILDRFFAILSEGVHRYEGTVNQYTGDGVMALFGAPIAHEDHPQRACHAALALTRAVRAYAQELRRERGLLFTTRMGLNSGEVVVGSIGDDLRMDYTAQGHTVGLAARMEHLCEPGRIYVTAHTAALVEGFFTLEDLGLFTVKGVRDPLRVFALVGPGPLRSRLDLSRARGLSRLVGREEEMAVLEAAHAEASAGRGAVVAVSAEAGIGKSRLCDELAERCAGRGAAVVATTALAHGASLPYLPILTLLRRLVGVEERDPPEQVRQKLAGALLLADDAYTSRLPLLFEFLGVADQARSPAGADADAHARAALDAAATLVRAGAARRPILVLVEDLHWLDPASEGFLRQLLPMLRDAAVTVVLNFRPEYRADWLDDLQARRVTLRPLAASANRDLADELLGTDVALDALKALLCERAAGNPFFTEELVRSLAQVGVLAGGRGAYRLERPLDAVAIPPTVQAVLAARIDRLGERAKEVLQTAAVIGKRFDFALLAAVTGASATEVSAALAELTGAELVYEEGGAAGSEYAFHHPLTQEVAYATQLGARRAVLHGAVARLLAGWPDAASAERAPLIAYHWEKAGDVAQAARWQQRAARALAGTDTRESVARLRRAVTLFESLPETEEAVTAALETYDNLFRLSTMADLSAGDIEALFQRARALAERSGQRALLARLLSSFNNLEMMMGRTGRAAAHLREAAALAREIDDSQLSFDVTIDQAQTAFWAGRLREALPLLDDAMVRLRDGGHDRAAAIAVGLNGEAFVRALRSLCFAFMGRAREAGAESALSLRLADASEATEGRCVARVFRSFVAHIVGEVDVAQRYGQAAMELALRADNPYLQRMADSLLGAAAVLGGRYAEGVAALERVARAAGAGDVLEWFVLPMLAEGYRRGGDPRRALATAEQAVGVSQRAGLLSAECIAQVAFAAALIDVEGAAARSRIEAALARSAELADASGAVAWRPRWHECRADFHAALGDDAGRQHELAEAVRLARQMGMDELADPWIRELGWGGGGGRGDA